MLALSQVPILILFCMPVLIMTLLKEIDEDCHLLQGFTYCLIHQIKNHCLILLKKLNVCKWPLYSFYKYLLLFVSSSYATVGLRIGQEGALLISLRYVIQDSKRGILQLDPFVQLISEMAKPVGLGHYPDYDSEYWWPLNLHSISIATQIMIMQCYCLFLSMIRSEPFDLFGSESLWMADSSPKHPHSLDEFQGNFMTLFVCHFLALKMLNILILGVILIDSTRFDTRSQSMRKVNFLNSALIHSISCLLY